MLHLIVYRPRQPEHPTELTFATYPMRFGSRHQALVFATEHPRVFGGMQVDVATLPETVDHWPVAQQTAQTCP